jgi:hypothetical protein
MGCLFVLVVVLCVSNHQPNQDRRAAGAWWGEGSEKERKRERKGARAVVGGSGEEKEKRNGSGCREFSIKTPHF